MAYSKRDSISNSSIVYKVALEPNYGDLIMTTDAEAKFQKFKIAESSISYSQNAVESELFGGTRSPSKSAKGNVEVSGNIKVGIDNNQFGFWAYALLGKYTQTDEAGKKKHSFTISKDNIPSIQLEKSYSGTPLTYRTTGVKVNSMSVEFGGEGELYATLEVIGRNEFFYPYRVNAKEVKLSQIENQGTNMLHLVSVDGINEKDTITIKKQITTLAKADRGDTSISVVAATDISKNDYITIEGAGAYQVKAVSGNVVYLSRGLEKAITASANVYLSTEIFVVKEVKKTEKAIVIDGTIDKGLKATDSVILDDKTSKMLYGTSFEQFEVSISSSKNSNITATAEKATFTLNNNAEGKRLIVDKGSFGKIVEGKVSATLEMDLIMDPENAMILENSKNDTIFDITLTAVNKDGESVSFIFPKGTITPKSPTAESPGAVSLSVTYSPFEDGNEAVEIVIKNNKSERYDV